MFWRDISKIDEAISHSILLETLRLDTRSIGIVRSTRSNDGMTCTVGECRVRWRCHSTQIRTVVGFWVSSCVQPNQDDNDSDQWNDETTRDTIRIELFHLLRETFSGKRWWLFLCSLLQLCKHTNLAQSQMFHYLDLVYQLLWTSNYARVTYSWGMKRHRMR